MRKGGGDILMVVPVRPYPPPELNSRRNFLILNGNKILKKEEKKSKKILNGKLLRVPLRGPRHNVIDDLKNFLIFFMNQSISYRI